MPKEGGNIFTILKLPIAIITVLIALFMAKYILPHSTRHLRDLHFDIHLMRV